MILVADSGSSKTDWLLAFPGQPHLKLSTSGLNPYFLSEKEIARVIHEQAPELTSRAAQIQEIYFFGAGCSSPDRREMVSNALSQLFPKAFISVDSDLLGSAYATCGHNKGLCCVLGTGSNISFFDGEDVIDGKHGLGYVLGDEGSGTWFGKALIADYLYGNMPADVHAAFRKAHPLSKEQVIQRVYMKAGANSYLASFAEFLSSIKDTAYGKNLIGTGLLEFIETDIKSYPQYQDHVCHFVGSIAYFFSTELKALCAEHNIAVGKIIRHPIEDLMEFVLERNHVAES
ncbi:N-acetylglucosamine kinase [Mucilaginibacter sp. Bleaf8]|uniref:N-acetylglucosamine kinase n=1 Tax=Mucilaginibacter sp. Bleaf8 TaxID=2834430 RepID=UPI001BCAA1F0|nr:N-acetylglucosamine kinase [Mucilaginibacter sp. Bleaf8]MBS7565829.1 N-acetylglucosamine kinase [Mucilaginibacter sp. Bleaf8]